jgi:pimeloyl-ACP methyl ester carboxylesterase
MNDREGYIQTGDGLRLYSGVETPTLVVHGAEDVQPLAGTQEWITALRSARLLLLPGIGHFPHLEAPEHFFPAVEEFLQCGWPGSVQSH